MRTGFLMVTSKIDLSRNSLQLDVKDGYKKITDSVALSKDSNNSSLADMKAKLDVTLPFKEVEDFVKFDTTLLTNKEIKKDCVSSLYQNLFAFAYNLLNIDKTNIIMKNFIYYKLI